MSNVSSAIRLGIGVLVWLAAATMVWASSGCSIGGTTNLSGEVIVEDVPGSPPTCTVATGLGDLCVEDAIEANGVITGLEPVARVTGDVTMTSSQGNLFCDTDGGAITITLPAGAAGRAYRIANVGSSGNAVTVSPDGAELLIGLNEDLSLLDGDVLIIVYEATEGWR